MVTPWFSPGLTPSQDRYPGARCESSPSFQIEKTLHLISLAKIALPHFHWIWWLSRDVKISVMPMSRESLNLLSFSWNSPTNSPFVSSPNPPSSSFFPQHPTFDSKYNPFPRSNPTNIKMVCTYSSCCRRFRCILTWPSLYSLTRAVRTRRTTSRSMPMLSNQPSWPLSRRQAENGVICTGMASPAPTASSPCERWRLLMEHTSWRWSSARARTRSWSTTSNGRRSLPSRKSSPPSRRHWALRFFCEGISLRSWGSEFSPHTNLQGSIKMTFKAQYQGCTGSHKGSFRKIQARSTLVMIQS